MAPIANVDTQPRLTRFSLHGLLNLPRRLCTPPPAVGKVRSFGLTPVFDITLEDILARKHLPPLSLKDFEEWLLFVDGDAQNLYFLLWVREYTARYGRWIKKVRAREARERAHPSRRDGLPASSPGAGPGPSSTSLSSSSGAFRYRVAWSNTLPMSPTLALFFARALDTFLSPDSPHALVLPPELAAQPHFLRALSAKTHPDPGVLANLRLHAEDTLRASLRRCVRAAFTNVGAYRATCGIVGGTVIALGGCVPILATNFTRGGSRWARLAILPPLWFGLTAILASLCGVCLMIYVFGDLRQLRHFELVRPPAPELESSASTGQAHEQTAVSSIHRPDYLGRPAPIQALTAPPKLPNVVVRFPPNPLYPENSALASIPESRFSASVHTSPDAGKMHSVSGISISPQMGTSHPHDRVLRPRDSFISDADTDTRRSEPVYVYPDSDDDSYMETQCGLSSYSYPHTQPQKSASQSRKQNRNQYGYAAESADRNRFEPQDNGEADDDESDFDDHGIYISPSMPAPEVLAEDDPAVVSAALALLAHSKMLAEQQVSMPTTPLEDTQLYEYGYQGDEQRYGSLPPTAPTSEVHYVPGAVSGLETSPISPTPTCAPPPPSRPQLQLQTASFIPSYTYSSNHVRSIAGAPRLLDYSDVPELGGSFDFDALPRPLPPTFSSPSSPIYRTEKADYGRSNSFSGAEEGYGHGYGYPLEFVPSRSDRISMQSQCASRHGRDIKQGNTPSPTSTTTLRHFLLSTSTLSLSTLKALLRPTSHLPSPAPSPPTLDPRFQTQSQLRMQKGKGEVAAQGRRLPEVRPFGPTTAVLAPVVARAHWEVVVRSAFLAALLCAAVCAGVVACPVPGSKSSLERWWNDTDFSKNAQ